MNKTIPKVGLSLVCIFLGSQVYLKLSSLKNSEKAVGTVLHTYETQNACVKLHLGKRVALCRQRYADIQYQGKNNQVSSGQLLIDESRYVQNSDLTAGTQVKILYDKVTGKLEKDNFISAYGMSILGSFLILLMLFAIVFA